MRNLLALAGLAFVAFLGLGWYLGWYNIRNASTPDGSHHLQIDVNADKVKSDVGKGENKVQQILTDMRQNNASSSAPSSAPGAPASTNGLQPTEDGSFVFPASRVTAPPGGESQPPPK